MALLFAAMKFASAGISLYASAPGIQTALDSGVTGSIATETFNSMSNGQVPASFTANNGGTYVSNDSVTINANDQYGGYNQGKYLSVNTPGSTETITFASGINYFGFLWTAGDASNKISFFDINGASLGSYTTADLLIFFPHNDTSTRTAINGVTNYYTGNYYGQPVATGPVPTVAPNLQTEANSPYLNTSEPYAYLHFISNTASIKTIVIEKTPTGGSFESDNHSVSANAVIPGNASVVLVTSAIPEPSTCALVGLGAALVLYRKSRRVRQA